MGDISEIESEPIGDSATSEVDENATSGEVIEDVIVPVPEISGPSISVLGYGQREQLITMAF